MFLITDGSTSSWFLYSKCPEFVVFLLSWPPHIKKKNKKNPLIHSLGPHQCAVQASIISIGNFHSGVGYCFHTSTIVSISFLLPVSQSNQHHNLSIRWCWSPSSSIWRINKTFSQYCCYWSLADKILFRSKYHSMHTV